MTSLTSERVVVYINGWYCFILGMRANLPPWYLYLVVVEWLACLNDPESYAGGSIAARRVTHAGQVKGDKPDKKYLGRKSDDLSL